MKLLVIGNPIRHSKSPLIHNFWLKEKKINCAYKSLLVNSQNLKGIIQKIKKGEILGINITLPFKQEIQQYVDFTDDDATYSGAINTIYKKKDKIIGTNTDGIGFVNSLKYDSNINLYGKNVFLIGAGGAARGIIFSLINHKIQKLIITNRSIEKTNNLVFDIKKQTNFNNIIIQEWSDKNVESQMDILINTTSYGMKKNEELNINFNDNRKNLVVYDIIYSPSQTYFLQKAKNYGFKTYNGSGMLVRQAAESFQKWFDIKISEKEIKKAISLIT